jgi:hypothetical protein
MAGFTTHGLGPAAAAEISRRLLAEMAAADKVLLGVRIVFMGCVADQYVGIGGGLSKT